MFNRLDTWHQTKLGLLGFAIVELALAYIFGSLAIAHGNLWWYLFTLILLVGFLQNLVRLIRSFFHGKK